METGIDSAVIEIQGNSKSAAEALEGLITQLDDLQKKINDATSSIDTFINTLKSIETNVSSMKFNTSNLDNISQKFEPLKNIGKNTNLENVTSQLESIPDLNEKLDDKVIEQFTNKIEQLNKVLEPLSTNLLRVGNALTNLPNNLNKVSSSVDKATSKTKKIDTLQNRLLNLANGVKFTALIAGLRQLANLIGKAVAQSTSYTETLNLFYVSMGEYSDRAKDFVDQFSSVLGVDPANVMRYIGDFNSLAESFGIAGEEAYIMSKNLTQLAYDISSFRNISIEDAMQKIRSGFVGEIEPMRAIGVALDEATLQETAYALGINKRISEMTRAQKTELLYYQMMQRTQYMQGDMARTLIQPANAIRVMKEQFTLLARAIGNIFIPIIMELIPYVMVLTKWLTTAAQAVANFFGFKIDTSAWENVGDIESNVSAGLDDIGDSASSATKELNKMLAPFDELNVIDFGNDKSGSSGSGTVGSGGSLGIPLYDYNALEGAILEDLTKVEDTLKRILPIIAAVGAGILSWKVGSSIINFLDKLGIINKLLPNGGISKALSIMLGISLVITGITLYFGSMKNLIEGDLSPITLLEALGGAGLIGVGAGLMFSGPVGLTIGLTLAIVALLTWAFQMNKTMEESILKPMANELGLDYDGMSLTQKIKFRWDMSMEVLGFSEPTNSYTKAIKDRLNEIIGPVKTWLEEKLKPVADAFSGVWENITDGFDNLKKTLGEVFEGFTPLTGLFEQIGNALGSIGEVIGLIFQEKWESLKQDFQDAVTVIQTIWQTLQPFFERLWETIKSIFNVVAPVIGGFFKTAWEVIKTVWNGVVGFFDNIWAGIEMVFSVVKGVLSGDFSDAWESIQNSWNTTVEWFQGIWDGISGIFSSIGEWFGDVFGAAWENIQTEWKDVTNWFSEIYNNIKQAFSDVKIWFSERFQEAKDSVQNIWNNIGNWFQEKYDNIKNVFTNIKPWFTEKFQGAKDSVQNVWNSIGSWFQEKYDNIKNVFGNIGTWFRDKFQEAKNSVQNVWNNIGSFFSGIWNNIKNTFSGLGTKIGEAMTNSIKNAFNRVVSSIESTINRAVRFINSAINFINNITGLSIGNVRQLSLPRLYAEGGFPETGEMFIARERGPELVGNIGNRAAVANNDQIIEGIRQGVYEAVTQANSGNSTTPQINVYLGNKKIYSGYGSYANSENNMYGVNVIK